MLCTRSVTRLLRESSSPKTTPLATTSDLLVSLESSDEEDGAPSTQGGRQSMPYSQQPRPREQQMVRRQTAEGHVSPPKTTTTALVSANGNGSAGAILEDIVGIQGHEGRNDAMCALFELRRNTYIHTYICNRNFVPSLWLTARSSSSLSRAPCSPLVDNAYVIASFKDNFRLPPRPPFSLVSCWRRLWRQRTLVCVYVWYPTARARARAVTA